ncbi:MAG: alpha/beta hydrolase [Brevundimonas sp.]|jgi:pimeloyl-ACP methyl ester carboxylesterase|uniref:alpha/beta fold hydrolase n=1 Tax=Brevundimonas sp. TaxID=1871086 RepID=UPI0025C020FA|nr:alpha/beta hydrolase [Brevundimonas sp.]MCH4269695.1 alpha/beta hydrolase [Brevundimonas sp.]
MQEVSQAVAERGLTEEGIINIPGLLSRHVRLANGSLAHYMTSGETGPAVILLHGGIEGSSGTAGFRFMCTMLGANGFRVYAPDRPGFGLSDVSKAEYLDAGPLAQIEFVKQFADALGIDKFHLSGNSAGCIMSIYFLMVHPERVLSAAVIAGLFGDIVETPTIPPSGGKFTENPGYVSPGFDGTKESMFALMNGIIYEQKAVWPELIEMRVRQANLQRDARGGPWHSRAILTEQDPDRALVISTKNRLNRLSIPMICMYGLQDVLIPVENGFNQEDRTPNIQFFYPDECGHQGQTDQPEMFNQVFLEFFKSGKVSWETAKWAGVSRRRPINPDLVEEPVGGFPKPVPEAYVDYPTLTAALAD